jgi:hypothetical protein
LRIISSFHDYYDSLTNFGGIDKSKVFVREERNIPSELHPNLKFDRSSSDKLIKLLHSREQDINGIPTVSIDFNRFSKVNSFIVIFAGIIYPGIKVHLESTPGICLWEDSYHYNKDSVLDKLKGLYVCSPYREAEIEKLFKFTGSILARDWAIENKISIVTDVESCDRRGRTWWTNPMLSRIGFQKALDPYTAFQELELFIGGVLTENKEIYQVPNDIKIQQAGFDLKTSFRKPKQS